MIRPRTYALFAFLLGFSFCCFSQSKDTKAGTIKVKKLYTSSEVDSLPRFYRHEFGFNGFINSSIRYPASAKDEGVAGNVLVSFVIDRTGKVGNVKVALSSGDGRLDAEAIRVISSSPDWFPAIKNAEKVDFTQTVQIFFKLR